MQYGNYNSSVIAQYLTNHAYLEMLENNKEKEIITISVKVIIHMIPIMRFQNI